VTVEFCRFSAPAGVEMPVISGFAGAFWAFLTN
jgi:hypothetical protein